MKTVPLIFLGTLFSLTTFAQVSFEEKKSRVDFLESLSSKAVSMDIDAYRRELQYEKVGISLTERAEKEANRLAETIKVQVFKAYEAAMEKTSPEEATREVQAAIEKDIVLLDPSLHDEIKNIAIQALEDAQRGAKSSEDSFEDLQKKLLPGVKDRSTFLNKNSELRSRLGVNFSKFSSEVMSDANRLEYSDKHEILKSLVSDFNNASFVTSSNMSIRSNQLSKSDTKISYQLKASFLGVSIEAGPSISFKREIKTNATVLAEGLNPVLLPDGNFDFFKRDGLGRIIELDGKPQRRNVSFSCDASLTFESIYSGGGGFSIQGAGVSLNNSSEYSNNVNLTSRRISVPEYIDGKTVTLKTLADLCHDDFLKTKIIETMSVYESLNIMMKNVVSGLTFSHPKTKCATDEHCLDWFNKRIGLVQFKNVPRCVEESREKYRACELRGLKGQNCSVYDSKGKRISEGTFEYKCDVGLKCVKVQDEGWFKNWEIYQYARGKCMPQ